MQRTSSFENHLRRDTVLTTIARSIRNLCSGATFIGLAAFAAASWAGDDGGGRYVAKTLVTDTSAGASWADPNLVNAWGIAFNPTGPVWLSDNGSGKSTLYDGTGKAIPLVVSVPAAPASGNVPGTPTGIVYNGAATAFMVSERSGTMNLSGSAKFLFASEDGVISGWSPAVDLTHAVVAVDRSLQGAVYKGLAIGGTGNGALLYATDFHNRRVDVFDAQFNPVTLSGGFVDPRIPVTFAPFGIQNVNGDIVVTYAKQDAAGHDAVAGAGLGYVDVFDPSGRLVKRLQGGEALDAPWGITLAPESFGRFGGALLIGNFGNGWINAFDPRNGELLGALREADGRPLRIDGLWGLSFGNGFDSQPTNTLFYAAGPGQEMHGAYGMIQSSPAMEDASD